MCSLCNMVFCWNNVCCNVRNNVPNWETHTVQILLFSCDILHTLPFCFYIIHIHTWHFRHNLLPIDLLPLQYLIQSFQLILTNINPSTRCQIIDPNYGQFCKLRGAISLCHTWRLSCWRGIRECLFLTVWDLFLYDQTLFLHFLLPTDPWHTVQSKTPAQKHTHRHWWMDSWAT